MVVTLVALAIVSGYTAAFKSINLAKSKMVAVSLANEKMEMLRNMSYDDLATVKGTYPPGNIPDDETVDRNGTKFNVHTAISYVDDPADGSVNGTPADIYPYDYKKVEVTVGKAGRDSQLAKLVTNVSAKAAETESNTGILSFCVIDSNGQPVADADVAVTNTTLTPVLNISAVTGEDGCVMLPKLPPDEHNNYHLSVTKEGYSTASTYPRTAQNPNALIPDINIIIQQVTSLTLVIDRVSTLEINFVDQTGQPVPNITFVLESSKLIYFNPDTYKLRNTYQTDALGYIKIPNLEYDNYKLLEVTPLNVISVSTLQPINLSAAANVQVQAVLSSSSTNPSIYNITPLNGRVGDAISITVDGGNFDNGLSIKLINPADNLEISGTNIDVQPHNLVVADFDLTSATPGKWDIIITNPSGESVRQVGAFNIVGI